MTARIRIPVPSDVRKRGQVTWRPEPSPESTPAILEVVELEVLQRNHAEHSMVVCALPCLADDPAIVVANVALARDPFAVWLYASKAIRDARFSADSWPTEGEK